MTDEMVNTIGDEVKAMTKIAEVLTPLSPDAKKRVLLWALRTVQEYLFLAQILCKPIHHGQPAEKAM